MAFGCSCAPDALCDGCVDDAFAQLRGVAACRGEVWAGELARRLSIARTAPWPRGREKAHALALLRVEDLTRDLRLRERLADELERWAARRWSNLADRIA